MKLLNGLMLMTAIGISLVTINATAAPKLSVSPLYANFVGSDKNGNELPYEISVQLSPAGSQSGNIQQVSSTIPGVVNTNGYFFKSRAFGLTTKGNAIPNGYINMNFEATVDNTVVNAGTRVLVKNGRFMGAQVGKRVGSVFCFFLAANTNDGSGNYGVVYIHCKSDK